MKTLLHQYGAYNIWANNHFITVLKGCTEEQLTKEMVSSFPTIKDTVYHLWSAEDLWIQRLYHVKSPVWRAGVFQGSFEEALTEWEHTSKALLQFVDNKDDNGALREDVEYLDLKKRPFKIPVYAGLMQVLNHATYHRGQLVTMLRQVGITDIPQTDFHVFAMQEG